MKSKLSSNHIKLIAVFAMIIDHIAWGFTLSNDTIFIMHLIGRITAPVMCFYIIEGYLHTHDLKGYIKRLFVFAMLSQLPFSYFQSGSINLVPLNMIFTLLIGLLGVCAYDRIINNHLKIFLLIILFYSSFLCDWLIIGFILPLIFFRLKDHPMKQYLSIIIISLFSVLIYREWYQLGIIYSVIIFI